MIEVWEVEVQLVTGIRRSIFGKPSAEPKQVEPMKIDANSLKDRSGPNADYYFPATGNDHPQMDWSIPSVLSSKPCEVEVPASTSMTPRRLYPYGPSGAVLGSRSRSIIAADLKIRGDLESGSEVHIDGAVHGDIYARRIVVGERGSVMGALTAEEIVVGGRAQGSIRGNRVTLQSSSRVEGEVFQEFLVIEQGAFFEGESRHSNDLMLV
jgi:cytoskeletal protein CcmA (bactofilin family)